MKKIRYLIEALILYILMGISSLLPVQWASNFGGWVGRTIGPKLAASRKAHNNVMNALPTLTEEQAKDVVTGMWDNLGRVMMEYPHIHEISQYKTEVIGEDILAKHKGQAAIIFSAHLANWECCPPAMLLQHDIQCVPIYRAPNNPFSDRMLNKARTLNGRIKTIPKSQSGTRHIVKTLQDKSFIGMLIDQKYNEGVQANFFNQPAMTSPIYVQLAQKFDCPLIPMRIERLEGPSFRITVLPPLNIKDKTVETVIDESHALLESWIKEQPEQWLWLHRRWMSNNSKKETNDT